MDYKTVEYKAFSWVVGIVLRIATEYFKIFLEICILLNTSVYFVKTAYINKYNMSAEWLST